MVVRGAPTQVTWDTCRADAGCPGARVGGAGECLAHLDAAAFVGVMAALAGGAALDGRGVHFTRGLSDRLLASMPVEDGRRRLGAVRFDGSVWDNDAVFDSVTFEGDVSFAGAELKGGARFGDTVFGCAADFGSAHFGAQAWFVGAAFSGTVSFDNATFSAPTWFRQARFAEAVSFDDAVFGDDVVATSAAFGGASSFVNATFERRVRFERCTYASGPDVEGARFLMEGEKAPAPESVEAEAVHVTPLVSAAPFRKHRRRLNIGFYVVSALVVVVIAGAAAYVMRPQATAPQYQPTTFGNEAAFAFLLRNDKTRLPARYNPCEPIHYVVNPQLGPSDWKVAVEAAVAEVGRASGMTFQFDGTTTEIVKPNTGMEYMAPTAALETKRNITTDEVAADYREFFGRSSLQPDRYGRDRWAPVLIEWAELEEEIASEVAGIGASEPRDIEGATVYVSGTAIINTILPRAQMKKALMHELGHVVGLAHVDDTFAVMKQGGRTGLPRYSAGDVAGLRKVGLPAGCVTSPPPGS